MYMHAVAEWRIGHTRIICKCANILIYWAPKLCIVGEYTSLNREPLQACTRDNNIIISYYVTIITNYKDWQRNKSPEARKMTTRH